MSGPKPIAAALAGGPRPRRGAPTEWAPRLQARPLPRRLPRFERPGPPQAASGWQFCSPLRMRVEAASGTGGHCPRRGGRPWRAPRSALHWPRAAALHGAHPAAPAHTLPKCADRATPCSDEKRRICWAQRVSGRLFAPRARGAAMPAGERGCRSLHTVRVCRGTTLGHSCCAQPDCAQVGKDRVRVLAQPSAVRGARLRPAANSTPRDAYGR